MTLPCISFFQFSINDSKWSQTGIYGFVSVLKIRLLLCIFNGPSRKSSKGKARSQWKNLELMLGKSYDGTKKTSTSLT